MEEYKNDALEELKEQQAKNMVAEIDKINDSPELQKIYDELDNKLGNSSISEIFSQEMEAEIEVEDEVAEEAAKPETEEEVVEEAEPEDEFPELADEAEFEDEVEVKEDKKGKGDKAKYLLTKENHRRLKQLQEKEEMLQEMERRNQELLYQVDVLRQSEAKSWETTSAYEYNYFKNELARGRAMYDLAVENGDKKAELDAIEAITDAKAKLHSVEMNYASQKASYTPAPQAAPVSQQQNYQPNPYPQAPYPNQYPPPQYNAPPPAPTDDPVAQSSKIINDWVRKHNVIDENSIYFDKGMKDKVVGYAQRYEQALKKAGKGNMILSDSYFNKLDGYIESEVERARADRQSKKPSTSHIGSVKGAAVSSNNKPKIDLTSEELKIIQGMNGDTEKIKAEWLRHKATTAETSGRKR